MDENGDFGGGGSSPWKPRGLAFCEYSRSHGSNGGEKSKGSGGHLVVVKKSLVSRLTKDIVETYQLCNPNFKHSEELNPKRFLTSPHIGVLNDGFDNSNSDLILSVNFVLFNEESKRRYIVKEMLGQGTFGQVVKCWVPDSNTYVAIKVIKNQSAYCHQAIHEINILRTLNQNFDRDNKHHIVRMHEFFIYQRHLCISFEMLGPNLYELLKMKHLKGLSLNSVQTFSKQILHALVVMKDAGIIHCDLKPENILLWTSFNRVKPSGVKVIDFGSACKEDQTVYSYIQSRYYRSPEVLLGYQYTTAIDMWSLGCIVAELFLGLPLFPASSEYDLLKRMMKIIGGQPPDILLRGAKKTNKFFKCVGSIHQLDHYHTDRNSYAYRLLTEEEFEAREQKKPVIGKWYFNHVKLEDIMGEYPYKRNLPEEEKSKERLIRLALIDFVKGLIEFDPEKRWTPLQACGHPFVTGEPFTQPYRPPLVAHHSPVIPNVRVDHGPDRGHWLGSGLSPQVSNICRTVQHSSPHFHMTPSSRGGSYGSWGSYGSYSNNPCPVSSYGSYGENNKVHDYYPSSVSSGLHIPLHAGRSTLGASPDARGVHQYSYGNGFGMSPTFRPMSLGVSPSQLTPPNSQIQISPGMYGQSPTSPSKVSPYGSQLGKTSSMCQYYKRRGWGHPAIMPMQHAEGASQHKHGHHSEGSDSEQNPQGLPGSPCSNELSQSSWRKEQVGKELRSGIPLPIHQNHRSLNLGKSADAIFSSESFSCRQECSTSLDSGHWDPNFSDELLQEEGLYGSNVVSGFSSIHLAPEMGLTASGIGSDRLKHGFFEACPVSNSVSTRTDGQVPMHSYATSSSSFGLDIQSAPKHPTYLPPQMLHFSQGSPSRFAQQPGHQFSQTQPVFPGDRNYQKVQLMRPSYSSEDPHTKGASVFGHGNAWGQAGHPIVATLPAYRSRNDFGRMS